MNKETVMIRTGEAAKLLKISGRILRELIRGGIIEGIGFGVKQKRIRFVTAASLRRFQDTGLSRCLTGADMGGNK